MSRGFEHLYPALSRWVQSHGYIELGWDDDNFHSRSFIRVIDAGGMVWESESNYPSLDEALRTADEAVALYMRDELGEQ